MDQAILVSEEKEAGAELVRRLGQVFPIRAAFWVKESEGSRWYLYIASEAVDGRNLLQRYHEVGRVVDEMAGAALDTLQVKLISAEDPLARAAIGIQQRDPAPLATRLGGTSFGGVGVEGVFLYPPPVAAAAP